MITRALGVVLLAACASGESRLPDEAHTGSGEPASRDPRDEAALGITHWEDSSTASERKSVLPALRALYKDVDEGDEPAFGAIRHLGHAPSPRFVLVATGRPGGNEDGHMMRLILLAPGSDSVTTPPVFETGVIYSGTNYGPLPPQDVDGDGWLDYLFCQFTGDYENGVARAIGFRDGRWYEISAARRLPSCND